MEQINVRALNVLVIARYDPTFDWVQLALQEQHYNIIGRVDSVELAWHEIRRAKIDIVLADVSGDGVHETEWIRKLVLESSEVLVLVIAMSTEMNFVREAMLAGAQGFLLKPFDLAELSRSIEQVHQLWLQRNVLLADVVDKDSPNKAHSIALYSPKGGTGVTTLTVNLAIALNQYSKAPVLLVDADLRTADVDIFLNVFSKLSILDLIQVNQPVDNELLKRVAKEYSGISVLPGDPRLQFIDAPIEPGQMVELLQELSAIWEGYIIVNTSNGLDRWTVEVLDTVDTVLVATTPQLSALRAVRNFLEMAEVHEDPAGKWNIVMTSYQHQKALQMSDIEASLRFPVKATINQDSALVATSINRGTPLVVSDSKSAIAKDIQALAKQIANKNPLSQEFGTVGSTKIDSNLIPNQPKRAGKRFWQFFSNSVGLSGNA